MHHQVFAVIYWVQRRELPGEPLLFMQALARCLAMFFFLMSFELKKLVSTTPLGYFSLTTRNMLFWNRHGHLEGARTRRRNYYQKIR